MPVPAVNPPVIFAWTPVNGATSYELQISDDVDIRSRVLVDVTLLGTTYTFSNIPDAGFTLLQPAGVPLSGGPLYWRVRALGPNSSTIFSSIARFTLGNSSSGMPVHNLAVASLGVARNPIAGIPSAILVRVENRGSFPAIGAYLTVTVNGQSSGVAERVKPLGPGDVDDMTLAWNPPASGITSIVATLNYADDVPASKVRTLNVAVEQQKSVPGTFTGIVGGTCGSYVLKDSRGNTIAQLLVAPGASATTLLSLYNQKASVTGNLTIGAQGPQISMQSIARIGTASNASSRNPCSAQAQARTVTTGILNLEGLISQPKPVTTSVLSLNGLVTQPKSVVTSALSLNGLITQPKTVTTSELSLSGIVSQPKGVITSELSLNGLATQPKTVTTSQLSLSGSISQTKMVTTAPLTLDGIVQKPKRKIP